MLIYTDEQNAKQYITIQPKFQRLSYPLGRCLRYHHSILTRAVEGVTTKRKIIFKNNFLLSYELVEEVSHGRAPVEMGISVNKTWMLENNITDINVYFKDPINNVPFISPKETFPD